MNNTHTIDATEKKLGRLATVVAQLLMGKDKPAFRKNAIPNFKVSIVNASKLSITDKKVLELIHSRYSGYPGGLTKQSGKSVRDKKGSAEIIRHAVSRMIPKTKHRSLMLKNLEITE